MEVSCAWVSSAEASVIETLSGKVIIDRIVRGCDGENRSELELRNEIYTYLPP